MITYITYYLPPPLFECDHNLSTVHFWAIMVHIEVFWAYFHKPPDFASVCLATWFKESSTVIHISNTRSHSDKKSIIPSFMVSNLPLVSGIHLLSALMEYHTLAPSSAWFPTKYTTDEGLFFKGLSKGLIPSDTIGVDFYIKKTEPHKKAEPLVSHSIRRARKVVVSFIYWSRMRDSFLPMPATRYTFNYNYRYRLNSSIKLFI